VEREVAGGTGPVPGGIDRVGAWGRVAGAEAVIRFLGFTAGKARVCCIFHFVFRVESIFLCMNGGSAIKRDFRALTLKVCMHGQFSRHRCQSFVSF